ncbi:MAG TPA: TIGR03943 family protein [Anaerolineaceae bacterium]|nr:TIGR03943 family protein [Anaerolineaceae bacterium]
MVVLSLAVYLAEKWASGRLSYYINLRFSPLILLSVVILTLMAAFGLSSLFSGKPDINGAQPQNSQKVTGNWFILSFVPVLTALSGLSLMIFFPFFLLVLAAGTIRLAALNHVETHNTERVSKISILSLFAISFPLLLGVLVPVQSLSATALNTRGMSLSAPASLGETVPATLQNIPDERNVLDWVKIFNYEEDVSSHTGETAEVIGFVYHDSRLLSGQFMVGRFAVTCCAADAFAIGMAVNWPDSQNLQDDTWVKVKGNVDLLVIDGQRIPLIHAESVTQVDVPEQPYLYP